jgi:hypothetical protein
MSLMLDVCCPENYKPTSKILGETQFGGGKRDYVVPAMLTNMVLLKEP